MDPITAFQTLVGERAAYPLVATILTFAIAIGKNTPYLKVWYSKIPQGWHWLLPVVSGGAMGFVKGYNAGYTWVGALVETVFGITGVSATAMGLNAALKDSPLPWSGTGAGSKPLPPKPPLNDAA